MRASRLARVRLLPNGRFDRIFAAIESADEFRFRYAAGGWDDAPRHLDGAARALRDEFELLLPPEARAGLEIEVGVVETRDGARRRRREYSVVFEHGALLMYSRRLRGEPLPSRAALRPAERLDRTLPVVLMPSAVLALVAAGVELRSVPTNVQVHRTMASPYPPHDGTVRQARVEGWNVPVDITEAHRFNLCVLHREKARAPERCLAIEAVRPRAAIRRGAMPWELRWSARENGERRPGAAPLVIELDAVRVLGLAAGACARLQPACERSAMEGDCWGWAPPFALGATLGELTELKA